MRSIALWAEPSRRCGGPDRVLRLLIAAVFTLMLVSGLAYAFLGVDFLTHSYLGLPCAFRSLTGLACPGCGMTRAFLLLSQLRLDDALAMNLAAPFLAGAMLWRLATSRRHTPEYGGLRDESAREQVQGLFHRQCRRRLLHVLL